MATNLQINSIKVGVRYEDSDGLLRIVPNKYVDSGTLPNAAILKGWVSRTLWAAPLTIVIQVSSDLVLAFLTTPLRATISIQGQFLGSYVLHLDAAGRGNFEISGICYLRRYHKGLCQKSVEIQKAHAGYVRVSWGALEAC